MAHFRLHFLSLLGTILCLFGATFLIRLGCQFPAHLGASDGMLKDRAPVEFTLQEPQFAALFRPDGDDISARLAIQIWIIW